MSHSEQELKVRVGGQGDGLKLRNADCVIAPIAPNPAIETNGIRQRRTRQDFWKELRFCSQL